MILPDSFWLWVNGKMKVLPHPFNEEEGGARELKYSPWEFEHFQEQTDWGDLQEWIKGKKVAELACGGGGKSVWMAANGAESVWGCDLSESLILQGGEFAKEKGVEGKCEFEVCDAQKTGRMEGKFGVVLLASILEHAENPEELVREAVRICEKGGRILVNTEGWWHWLGHHLWDALPIPWLHLMTSEKQRVRLYKKVVQEFPDGEARLKFRLDKKGEKVGYLNGITLKKMERILEKLKKEELMEVEKWEVRKFGNVVLRSLGGLPILREALHERVVGVFRKV